ncbi:MAG: MFS transporter [Thermodesulfobacteriota bacterium]
MSVGVRLVIGLKKKLLFISVLYFAEGFPFGLIWDALPVYLRLKGLSLQEVGLLSLVSLPWSIKFLWAPVVDRWGRLVHWIVAGQFLMGALLVAASVVATGGALLWAWLLVMAMLSATQDIAIDAYSIRLLEPQQMGVANGVRVSAYRVALIAAGGLLIALAGEIGWDRAFMISGILVLSCGLFSCFLPFQGRALGEKASILDPLRDLASRPGAWKVILFILLYKLGDMAMGPMVRPFWVDRGLAPSEIGFITGTGGILAGITGALVGGTFTSRFGIFHGLWFMGIWQAMSNLGYALVAMMPQTGHQGVYAGSMIESFCGGLGTAAFLAFLMSICNRDWAATQYALLSALFGLARSVSGALSGWAAAGMGYPAYFVLTFLMALPAFFFLRAARRWIPR